MDYTLGSIALFPYQFVPEGWLLCNGQTVSIYKYQGLYALVGNQYGGDGSTIFGLPNLQGLEPHPNVKYFICFSGIYPDRP